MKNLRSYTWLLLIAILPLGASAQTIEDEKSAIENVLKNYISVTDKQDSTAILKAFHPDAKLMSVTKEGLLKSLTLSDWWNRISKIENPAQRKYKITVLDVSGITAVAKIEFANSVDCLSLLKFNGEWKIVNKTLSVSL